MSKFLGEFEELVLLAILKLGENAYGVPIASLIEEATGKTVSTGALYTTCARLEEKGLISSRIGEASAVRGGRAKKFYAVEISGKEAIKSSDQVRRELSAGLTFA